MRHESQAVRRAVSGDLVDGLPAGFADDGSVFLGHRACDPGDVVVSDKAPQSGHEAAPAPPRHSLAFLVADERGGPTIRDHD